MQHQLISILFLCALLSAVCGQDSNTCCYKFKDPQFPSFTLPPSQPNSPGDITLNPNNPIILANGDDLNPGQGCNGDKTEYIDDNGNWTSSYIDCNGAQQDSINLFYATAQDKLNLRTIQTWQANISEILNNRTLRLWITCNNGLYSCVEFTVNGTSHDTINGDANGTCFAAADVLAWNNALVFISAIFVAIMSIVSM